MSKADIKIGRFEQGKDIAYFVRQGEHYVLRPNQTIMVSENGNRLWGAREAEQSMWVDKTGFGYIGLPSGYAKGEFKDFNQYTMMFDQDIETELKQIVDKNKGAPFGALMGQAMAKLKGKASGQKISEILKKLTS